MTTLTADETERRVGELLARKRREAAAVRPSKRRGRPQTKRTRERIAARQFARHRANALANPDALHPLKLHRLTWRDKGLTAAELADRSTTAVSLIRKVENGHHKPSWPTWRRLARALGVSEAEIRPDDDSGR
jgi:ribosome-binding protein aMBF1 (putative translation factor)